MRNSFEVRPDGTVAILLRSRKEGVREALIDAADFLRVADVPAGWYLAKWKGGYLMAKARLVSGDPNSIVFMHRYLASAPSGMVVDHINHNTLDNRRSNLRVVTIAENGQNRLTNKNKAIPDSRNVYEDKVSHRYRVQMMIDGRKRDFGRFDDLGAAIEHAREMRRKYMPYATE